MKLCVQVGGTKRTNWFDFGDDLNPGLDSRILYNDSSPLRDGAKTDIA